MLTGRKDRLWAIGGLFAAAVLLVVGWFFLITPQNAETDRLAEETGAAEVRAATLQSRIAQLSEEQKTSQGRYDEELAAAREALPTTARSGEFLRELQAAGVAADVEVSGLTVGTPSGVTAGGVTIYALPVAVTAEGRITALDGFLNQIQRVQPRAVLIKNATLLEAREETPPTLAVNLLIFVASPTGTAPVPAPDTN